MTMGMRRGRESEVIMDGDRFAGVNCGCDFTAEHEWGIKPICNDFGIPLKPEGDMVGIAGRTITRIPDSYASFEFDHAGRKWWGIASAAIFGPCPWRKEMTHEKVMEHLLNRAELHDWDFEPDRIKSIYAAWSDGEFFVMLDDESHWQDLVEAFEKKDIAFFLMKSTRNPFSNYGLHIMIASRIPKDIVEGLEAFDKGGK